MFYFADGSNEPRPRRLGPSFADFFEIETPSVRSIVRRARSASDRVFSKNTDALVCASCRNSNTVSGVERRSDARFRRDRKLLRKNGLPFVAEDNRNTKKHNQSYYLI